MMNREDIGYTVIKATESEFDANILFIARPSREQEE
jgi:hypothetical protein